MLGYDVMAILVVSLVCGLLGTYLTRMMAQKIGLTCQPNPIVPQHTKPVPQVGGIGVLFGILSAWAVWALFIYNNQPQHAGVKAFIGPVAIPAVLFAGLGLIDDICPLTARTKFTVQTVLAAIAVLLGLKVNLTNIALLDAIIALIWIVALVNAFNLTDVCDGLVTSISVVVFVYLSLTYPSLAILGLAPAGACIGFFVFNKPQASIFLGDIGSHLLGFLAAALTIRVGQVSEGLPWPYIIQVPIVLGIPLFELGFLVIVRSKKSIPWWQGSPDHFSLRLQAAGLSKWITNTVALLACAFLCLAAWMIGITSLTGQILVLAVVLFGVYICGRILMKWEVCRDVADRKQVSVRYSTITEQTTDESL